MKQLDERILEHLDQYGWATPNMIAREEQISCSEGHVWERCQRLHYVGFIDPFHSDMYELTTDGRLYLEGKVDARYRPWPTVERVLQK